MASSTMIAQLAGSPSDVWPKITAAIAAIGGKVTNEDHAFGVIEANVGASIWSWGEKMRISIAPKDGGSPVTVESKSRIPITLFDWGKNKGSVTRLAEQLNVS